MAIKPFVKGAQVQQKQPQSGIKPFVPVKRAPVQRPDVRQSQKYLNAQANAQKAQEESAKLNSFGSLAKETAKGTGRTLLNFGKEILRTPLTVPLKVTQTLTEAITKKPQVYTPQTGVEKFFYGNQPRQSYTQDQADIQKWAKEKGFGKGASVAMGAGGAIAEAGLDLLPAGFGGKAISKLKALKPFTKTARTAEIAPKSLTTSNQLNLNIPYQETSTINQVGQGVTETRLRGELSDLQTQRMRASLAMERQTPKGYQSGLKFEAKEIPVKKEVKPLMQETDAEILHAQKSKEKLLNDLAQERKALEESLSGGQTREIGAMDEGFEQYGSSMNMRRFSEHSPMYREYFKKNGRKPPLYVYKKLVEEEIQRGIHPASGEFKAIDDYINIVRKSQSTPIKQENPLIQEGVGQTFLKTKGEITTQKINYKKFIEENLGINNKRPDTRALARQIEGVEKELKRPDLFVQDMQPGVTKKFSAPRKLVTSGERILEESGEGGKELARRIRGQQQDYQIARGHDEKFIDDVFEGFSKDEAIEVTEILEGAKPLNKKTGTAAKILRKYLNKRQSQAKEAGLDVGYLENYFPRKYDFDELTKSARKEEVLQQMVSGGQAGTKAEAEKILQDFIFKNSERKAGNLEYERLYNIPGYEKDPRIALKKYADSVSSRLSEIRYFGKKDEIANSLINKISEGGGDYREAQRVFDMMYKGEPQNKLVNKLTKFQVLTKLSLAFFSNATQSVNTASIGGIGNTAKAIAKQLTKTGRKETDDFAKIAGAYQDMNIVQELGFEPGKLMNYVMTPFNIVERFNRRVAATSGKLRAQELVGKLKQNPKDKFVVDSLEKLGLDPAKLFSGKINEQDLLKVANTFTNKTQFLANAFNIPPAWRTPTGKLLSQFKSFSFMQTKFVRDEVLKEAKKGNVAPLVKFLLLAPIASYAAQTARNKVNMVSPEKEAKQGTTRPMDRYLNAYGTIPTDLVTQVGYAIGETGKPYTSQIRNIKNFVSPFVGPTIGEGLEIASTAESSYQTDKDNQQDYANHPLAQQDASLPWKRYGASHIPFAGRALMNTAFDFQPTVAKQAKEQAFEALRSDNIAGFQEAIKKDPYLNDKEVLQRLISDSVDKDLPEKEKQEIRKALNKKYNPFYQTK